VQADGRPFRNSTADKVTIPSTSDVADFRKAVKAENPNKLSFIDASDLKVYKNMAELRGKPIEEDAAMNGLGEELGMHKKNALLVLMPEGNLLLHFLTKFSS
jgi:hypothetical protein